MDTHAYTHTTTRAHPPIIHIVRREANKIVSSQSPTATPRTPKKIHCQSFLGSPMLSPACLGTAGPKSAALELTQIHPDLAGQLSSGSHAPTTVGTVGTQGTGTSGDMRRLNCSRPAAGWKDPSSTPGSLKTSGFPSTRPDLSVSPAIAWASSLVSSLGTFPLSSFGLVLRASVSQSQTRLRHAAHRLVNHVFRSEKLFLQG